MEARPATPRTAPESAPRWCAWASLDGRSVAAFRVCMALLVLGDLARRWGDIEAFLTDEGVVPPGDTPHHAPLHRLLFFRGPSVAAQQALFAAHALAAAALLVGARTRLAAVAVWAFTAALHGRNEYVNDCGDRLERNLLFWLAMLDSGRFLSVDAARARRRDALAKRAGDGSGKLGGARPPARMLSFATAGLYLQVAALYWAALMFRRHGTMWFGTLEATHYALHNPAMARPLAVALRAWPGLCRALTASVTAFEVAGPALLPVVRGARGRLALLAAFWGMQLGFGAGLRLELFPFASVAAMVPFLPAAVWDAVPAAAAGTLSAGPPTAAGRRRPASWYATGAVRAFFFAYVLVLNLGDVGLVTKPDGGDLGEALRINQYFVMFSPDPSRDGRWTAIHGDTAGRRPRRVDVLEAIRAGFEGPRAWLDAPGDPAAPAPHDASLPSDRYASLRWQKYLDEAGRKRHAPRMRQVCRHACRRWRGPAGERLARVQYYDVTVRLPAPGEPGPFAKGPVARLVTTHECAEFGDAKRKE